MESVQSSWVHQHRAQNVYIRLGLGEEMEKPYIESWVTENFQIMNNNWYSELANDC